MCPNLTAPANGFVTFETDIGSVAEYSCEDGFLLANGSQQRQCGAEGQWSGEEPRCSECWEEEKCFARGSGFRMLA